MRRVPISTGDSEKAAEQKNKKAIETKKVIRFIGSSLLMVNDDGALLHGSTQQFECGNRAVRPV